MNKKFLLFTLGLCMSFSTSLFAANCTESVNVADFEDGTNAMNGGYDITTEVVVNPSADGNASSKCLQAKCIEQWGTIALFTTVDYSKYGLSFLVYMETPGDITAVAYDGTNSYELKYSVFEAKKWTKVSFDFSKICPSSNSIQIRPYTTNTILIDDVKLVCLEDLSGVQGETGMEVPYSYGTIAIGGGGFVSGLISCGNSKYARTDVGGAYKWNEADCSWKPITNFISEDDKGLLRIEALAVDPSNENNIYLLAGCQYFSNQKTAVMYSKDGGKTFNTSDITNLLFVHGNGDGRNCGERIAVDPNNSNIIFCGGRANNPLIKSTDGGKTWTAVNFPAVYSTSVNWPSWGSNSVKTTPDNNGITNVVFDKNKKANSATSRIFVGVSRTNDSNVYVSEDGGASWSAITSLPTKWMPLRMKMDPDGNLLISYADKCAYGTSGGAYRYNPNTKTATDISPANKSIGDIAVSPKDANKLVASTNSTWIPQAWDNGSSANGDIFYTSTDGGKTWRSLQDNRTITNNGVTWIPGYAIHWCGSVCFHPNDDNKVSFASGNGIFTCNNIWCDGKPTFYFDVNGLEETVPLDMVSVPDGNLYTVIGDYSGFIHNNIHEFAPIYSVAPGTTGGINFYSGDPKIMMRVANTGFYYTTNGDNGWKEMGKTSYSYSNPYCSTCSPLASNEGKCAITKVNGNMRYFVVPGPNESGIFYSDNNGSSWSAVSGTQAAGDIKTDPVNDAYIYAGGNNVVYVSSDYGKTFKSVSLTNGGWYRLCVIPGHEGLVYAPCGTSGLQVSTDHGTSFKGLNKVTTCYAVGAGKGLTDNSYTLYIWGKANGNAMGLYRSIDEGASWQRINDDQNQFGGTGNGKFVIGDWNNFGRFYMSTVGLGIVYGELAEKATSSEWKCFVDNTDCKIEDTNVKEPLNGLKAINIYPNPFVESFTLQSVGEYTVSDITGRQIEKGWSDGDSKLGYDWTSGFYTINTNGEAIKVLKQ
ncbi:MAG TPA: hypothetical protein PKW49_01675 [Paludibacteraceae bacterium]|nr:hypothetical protein [Paludibacteraceae bacterium]HQF49389.1 hypothetical protein [Paludibacteraceae bacterium]